MKKFDLSIVALQWQIISILQPNPTFVAKANTGMSIKNYQDKQNKTYLQDSPYQEC